MRCAAVLALVVLATCLGAVSAADAAPTSEVGLGGIARVDIGLYHACGVTTGHQLRCWGDGDNGKLGINDLGEASHDEAVTVLNGQGSGSLANVASASVGRESTCALLTNGQVRCWGSDFTGQLGNGPTDTANHHLPVAVRNPADTANLTGVAQLSVGDSHACAVLESGQVRCWGQNDYGELGIGTADPSIDRPGVVLAVTGSGPLTGVAAVDAGDDHTCARLTNGQVRCWGWGLGTGSGSPTNVNRPVVTRTASGTGALSGVTQVSAGSYLTCARLSNGQARCWGDNARGELGIGSAGGYRLRPAVVESPNGSGPLMSVRSVAAGGQFACAVVSTGGGQARCWGDRNYGQVGDGNDDGDPVVRPHVVRAVSGPGALTGVTQIATGEQQTCARLANGQARCWGANDHGQVGDGTTGTHRPRPRVVQA